ncbi:unnamed protein product, partial [Amoebophrya sp. A120]|eukprot:GSA120T00004390001.1
MTEVNPDILGAKHYASRNYNDLRQAANTERNRLDWLYTLRQHYPRKQQTRAGSGDGFAAHSPRDKPSHTTPPEEGPYQSRWRSRSEQIPPESEMFANEKYGNFADTRPMLQNAATMRVSGGGYSEINWQLNLRGGKAGKPDLKWKRYFSKSHQSFDLAKTNFADGQYEEKFTNPKTQERL